MDTCTARAALVGVPGSGTLVGSAWRGCLCRCCAGVNNTPVSMRLRCCGNTAGAMRAGGGGGLGGRGGGGGGGVAWIIGLRSQSGGNQSDVPHRGGGGSAEGRQGLEVGAVRKQCGEGRRSDAGGSPTRFALRVCGVKSRRKLTNLYRATYPVSKYTYETSPLL